MSVGAFQGTTVTVCNIDEEGRFGGPERRIVLVAEGLPQYGVETLILIPKLDSKKFEAEIVQRHLWYEKLDFSRLTLELGKLARYVVRFPADLLATVMMLRRHKVDLVHVNGSYQFRSAIAAFLASKRLVWHVNDARMHWLVKGVFRFLAPRISDAFIFSSAAAREYYFPAGFDRTRIRWATIAPPVQVERFAPRDACHPAAAGTEVVKIVTVTGINPDKGVEYFIQSAAMVYRACPRARFLVAAAIHDSHARYFAQLQALLAEIDIPEDVVQFIGFVDDIPAFLGQGDIFLYTSNTEAGPAAVWEALAAGLPVVTTNVGAIPEYLQHGVDALIAPPRDARLLAELTLRLVGDSDLRASLAHSGRMKVTEYLSVDAAARKHADLYRETLANA